MTPQRFEACAAAYGGDLARWPASDRKAALEALGRHPELRALCEQAAELDSLLDSWTLAPAAGLAERVLAAAPAGRRSTMSPSFAWLPGAGMLGALGVGALAGAALVLTAGPLHVRNEGWGALYDQSSFGDLAQADTPHGEAGG